MEEAANNTITDLRSELFSTLRALKDKEKPMDIDRAKAIAEVAGKIIDSARVEVDFAKVTGHNTGSGFLLPDKENRPGVTTHRLK